MPCRDASTRRCYRLANVRGRRGGSQRDMGGRHQGSYLSESVLLLLDQNPSVNLKVTEGCLIGDK